MGAIEGLSHIAFVVRDLHRMEDILTTVLGARKVYDHDNHLFELHAGTLQARLARYVQGR
jgi:catechol 2,3-dioxygenase-like lactoylglutathione lyase family enzyme